MNRYSLPWGTVGGLLLAAHAPAHAQAPALTSLAPVANARTAPRRTPVVATFSQPLTAGSAPALKVFSNQRGGLRTAAAPATVSGNALRFAPAPYDFRPGETVRYTITAGAQASTGPLPQPWVGQFTAATTPGGVPVMSGGAELATGSFPPAVAVGDLDGDGDLDLLAPSGAIVGFSGEMNIFFNAGNATFVRQPGYPLARLAQAIAVGDLDGDGDLDFVCGTGTGTVGFNTGNGTFVPGSYAGSASAPAAIALGDLDGDGDLDLVETYDSFNQNGPYVGVAAVFFNDGTGTFVKQPDVAVGLRPIGLALGDVDNDGDLDFVTANGGLYGVPLNTVSIRLNDGHGAFTATPDPTVGVAPQRVALGDIDGDNDLDLLVAGNSTANGSVFWLRNNGSGTFAIISNSYAGGAPRGLALGDLDGDGDLDYVVANWDSTPHIATTSLNNGSGSFSTRQAVTFTTSPGDVALGDLDGDGDLDLVTANTANNALGVRLNNGTGPLATGPGRLAGSGPAALTAAPNPATGRVMLTLPPAATSAELLDPLGRVVRRVPAPAGTSTLDVAGLPSGLYVVRAAGQATRLVVE
ncbi:T9SS type A sorting domain-containing protein [Hymenobacter sp. DH14]|uniref:T9SS type A sorting domain-containing protein n=1 Tax=Hymenobacter cyanobacteriorum TaxID=2926463 RepID=A0A9X1VEJ1_9BACT|nr:T9SS type A sorting domain-containing protein [Hymenobacter cyanobacteriorum]MCI1187242.1 T9SS type A sorting domain-containing protein [Hymenobacter cyanobacteriorum]